MNFNDATVAVEPRRTSAEATSPKKASASDDPGVYNLSAHSEMSAYQDFNTYSALSNTWRVDQNAPFFLSPGTRIFDEQPGDVSRRPYHTHHTQIISSDSSKEFGSEFSSSVGVKGSYHAFDGAAQASLNKISSRHVKMFRRTQNSLFRSFKLSSDVARPYTRLSEGWKQFLLREPVHKIHHRLGDFFATELTYGGAIQITTATSMMQGDSKSSVQAELNANYNAIFASATASISAGGSSSHASSKRSFQSKTSTLGGNTAIWAQLTRINFAEVQKKWAESIDSTNQFEVEFRLVPIWQLLDQEDMDRAKAQQLKRFMLDKWHRESVRIPDYAPDAGPVSTCARHYTCKRPRTWCTHTGATYTQYDCDGDGILDHVCQDRNGGEGFLSSAAHCRSTWPRGRCQAKKTPCSRPSSWCTHKGAIYSQLDCDGDGILDHHCKDDRSEGFRSSAAGCRDRWPRGKCGAR